MTNEKVKEFLVKNKKPLIGTGIVAVLGTASYFIFFDKDSLGRSAYDKWANKDKITVDLSKAPKAVKNIINGK